MTYKDGAVWKIFPPTHIRRYLIRTKEGTIKQVNQNRIKIITQEENMSFQKYVDKVLNEDNIEEAKGDAIATLISKFDKLRSKTQKAMARMERQLMGSEAAWEEKEIYTDAGIEAKQIVDSVKGKLKKMKLDEDRSIIRDEIVETQNLPTGCV
jgi:hypothetical protein